MLSQDFLKEAIICLDNAKELDSEDPRVLSNSITLMLIENEPNEALELANRLVELYPDQYFTYIQRSKAYIKKNDYGSISDIDELEIINDNKPLMGGGKRKIFYDI